MHTSTAPTRFPAPRLAALLVLAAALAQGVAAGATPPPPSGDFRGFSGVHWASDFDVRKGHCDRQHITERPRRSEAISSMGQRQLLNRGAALLIGARVPDLLPVKFDAELDEGDRACMGQILELGASGRWVRWDNGATGIHYEMRPDAGRDGIAGACRGFKLNASGNYQHARRKAMACETGPGLWQLSGL
ncbi:MAG TPA: hypothetical protein VMC02_02925 [Steroidobacteraceae bacterium]|nr:hypothetical protein [Steroidobacteraceae bacterium]